MADFVADLWDFDLFEIEAHSTSVVVYAAGGVPSPPETEIDSIVQVALNAVRVTFTGPVRAFDPGDVHDARHVPAWALSLLEPFGAAIPLVQSVEAVSPSGALASAVIVRFDSALEAGARYHLTAFEVFDDGADFVGGCPL